MSNEFGIGLIQAKFEVQQYKMLLIREEMDSHIAQLLSGIKLILGLSEKNSELIKDSIKIAQETLSTALGNLHALTVTIENNWLERFSLSDHLKAEIQRINHWNKLNVVFKNSIDDYRAECSTQLILFALIIELFDKCKNCPNSNIISIEMAYNNKLELIIQYDGPVVSIEQINKNNWGKVKYYLDLIKAKLTVTSKEKCFDSLIIALD